MSKMSRTFKDYMHPCPKCGGNSFYSRSKDCVGCRSRKFEAVQEREVVETVIGGNGVIIPRESREDKIKRLMYGVRYDVAYDDNIITAALRDPLSKAKEPPFSGRALMFDDKK